jgi:ATP-binding cassette subfamily C (CFTR/MRP) protein 1
METSIGAVSRIKSFSETTPAEEPTSPSLPLPLTTNWLHSGRIQITNLTASHSPDSAPVLKDVNLDIASGEHVGICGRSGSGKSSLLAVLLRLMSVQSGNVLIDGMNIGGLPINQLRSSLTTLSQETFFLRGTVRDNLISSGGKEESDEQLQAVLERVGLWHKVKGSGGLDVDLDAEEAFSHGERQLFVLARAMLSPSKILLLDEFTSKFVPRLPFPHLISVACPRLTITPSQRRQPNRPPHAIHHSQLLRELHHRGCSTSPRHNPRFRSCCGARCRTSSRGWQASRIAGDGRRD